MSQLITVVAMGLVAMVLEADPVAVTWTGSPTFTTDCEACGFGWQPDIYESQNGPEADVSESSGTGVLQVGNYQSGDTISTPFTITSEAQVELTVTADYGAYGSTCSPARCDPTLTSWTFAGQFSGGSEIVDSSGNVDLSLVWGASGSTPASCQDEYCVAQLSLVSDVSGALDLAAGTYTLLNFEENSNQSIGDNSSGVGVTESLVDPGAAVPEPRWIPGVLAGMLVWWRRRSR